jgi:hypothetical protein
MKSYPKAVLVLLLGSLVFLTACASSSTTSGPAEPLPQAAESDAPVTEDASEPLPKETVAEEPAVEVTTLLKISQVWRGNSVSLSILDSNGQSCEAQVQSQECQGFYIGWRANFNDSDRVVEYGFPETVISDLQVGDQGAFLLMYQEVPGPGGSDPIVVKEFPFSYNY